MPSSENLTPSDFYVFKEEPAQVTYFLAEVNIPVEDLLEKKDELSKRKDDRRSTYERDGDRVMSSLFLQRLQNISQVDHPTAYKEFERKDGSAWGKQYYNSRLTHTFQVARLARQIANRYVNLPDDHPDRPVVDLYGEIYPDVAEAAALAHDIGHPPYGHVCESFLAEAMEGEGGFEGNAQTMRILTTLNPGPYRTGADLTRRTFAACLKYPWTYAETKDPDTGEERVSKYSLYDAFDTIYGKPLEGARLLSWIYQQDGTIRDEPPSIRIKTPEAEIMDFADDVAYATSDFFEAFPDNENLRELLEWENFRKFVKGSHWLQDSIRRMGLTLDIEGNPDAVLQLGWTHATLNLGDVENHVVNWAFLYLIHSLILEQVRLRQKTTDFILAMEVEKVLKHILLSHSWKIPLGEFQLPRSWQEREAKFAALKEGEYLADDTFKIVAPYPIDIQIGKDVKVYRTAKVGRIPRVLLCVLKHAVIQFVHKDGDQRARHVLRGLRNAILLRTFIARWAYLVDDRFEFAKAIFHDRAIKAVKEEVSLHSMDKGTKALAETIKARFCCDLLASQSEMAVDDLFKEFCTDSDGASGLRRFNADASQAFDATWSAEKQHRFFGEVGDKATEMVQTVVLNWGFANHNALVGEAWNHFQNLLGRGDSAGPAKQKGPDPEDPGTAEPDMDEEK